MRRESNSVASAGARQRGGESLNNLVPRTEEYVTFSHADIEAGNYSEAVVLWQLALVMGSYCIEFNIWQFFVTPGGNGHEK